MNGVDGVTWIVVPSGGRLDPRLYSKKEIADAFAASYLYVLP